MSTFVAIPTSAVSPPKNRNSNCAKYVDSDAFKGGNEEYKNAINKVNQRIANSYYRFQKIEKASQNSSKQFKNEVINIKYKLKNVNDLVNNDISTLMSYNKDEFDKKIFSFQNSIDEINNGLDSLNIKLNNITNEKINLKLLYECMTNIENYRQNHDMQKLRLTQFNNRLLQFKYRTDYCMHEIEINRAKLNNNHTLTTIKNELSEISEMFNLYLSDINYNLNKLDNLDDLHNKLNNMHNQIEYLNENLKHASEFIKKKEHKYKVTLTLTSATPKNAMAKKNEIKVLADEARINNWSRNWTHHLQKTNPYMKTLIKYYENSTNIPQRYLFIGKYQKTMPKFFFHKKYIRYEPYYRVGSRDVIAENSEDQREPTVENSDSQRENSDV